MPSRPPASSSGGRPRTDAPPKAAPTRGALTSILMGAATGAVVALGMEGVPVGLFAEYGAVRRHRFAIGEFVEPITVCDPGHFSASTSSSSPTRWTR